MCIILYAKQAIAKCCQQFILEKDSITQVVGQMKSNKYQCRIQGDQGDALEDAPLAAMRAPSGDSFGNRTSCSAYHIDSSCLPCLWGVIDSSHTFGCVL